jgi:hypothetical protein
MDAWSGVETSDLAYDDDESVFTQLLVDQGYLAAERWAGKKPRYFIEVKTTVGECSIPFFMSKNQYAMVSSIPYPRILSCVDQERLSSFFRS